LFRQISLKSTEHLQGRILRCENWAPELALMLGGIDLANTCFNGLTPSGLPDRYSFLHARYYATHITASQFLDKPRFRRRRKEL